MQSAKNLGYPTARQKPVHARAPTLVYLHAWTYTETCILCREASAHTHSAHTPTFHTRQAPDGLHTSTHWSADDWRTLQTKLHISNQHRHTLAEGMHDILAEKIPTPRFAGLANQLGVDNSKDYDWYIYGYLVHTSKSNPCGSSCLEPPAVLIIARSTEHQRVYQTCSSDMLMHVIPQRLCDCTTYSEWKRLLHLRVFKSRSLLPCTPLARCARPSAKSDSMTHLPH